MRHRFLLILFLLFTRVAFTQQNQPKMGWKNLDYLEDSVIGISMEKAYRDLLKSKRPDTIIVAVIDNGIDTSHEDLKNVLWQNQGEDGFDSDKNGYKGDKYGWNFLGGKDGRMLYSVPYEFERQYFYLQGKYANLDLADVKRKQRREYRLWHQVKDKFQRDSIIAVNGFWSSLNKLLEADSIIRKVLGKDEYVYDDLKDRIPENNFMKELIQFQRTITNLQYLASRRSGVQTVLSSFTLSEIEHSAKKRDTIIGDVYSDINDRYYGNNNVHGKAGSSMHGTHVAGIIGAVRNNGKGMNGVANAVKIMSIRTVPQKGDEYDKDVALSVRYAVDMGAKVINMSFAKGFSPQQEWVEDAIRYAAKKDVLIVNGAGNNGYNIDSIPNYPTARYLKRNKRAHNMITVGASGPTIKNLIASFSNYGKKTVDVFAPGIDIYSALPLNQYGMESGTSMAAPVVSGLAAVLRSYYPMLSAKQIKRIIETSVMKIDESVMIPGRSQEKGSMRELCKSGGIVNAYNAILLAEKFTSKF